MNKIKFFKSHELLLQEKLKTINQINSLLDRARNDYINSLNIIASELGIPEKELSNWKVTSDQKAIEKKTKEETKK